MASVELTEKDVLENVRWLSDRISTQVRVVAAGILALAWGLIVQPQPVLWIDRRQLLVTAMLALLVFVVDLAQYVAGYMNAQRYLRRLERGEKVAGYNTKDWGHRLRRWGFWAKLWLAGVAFAYMIGTVGPATLGRP